MPKYRSGKSPVCVQETGLVQGTSTQTSQKEAEVDQIMLMAIMTIQQLTACCYQYISKLPFTLSRPDLVTLSSLKKQFLTAQNYSCWYENPTSTSSLCPIEVPLISSCLKQDIKAGLRFIQVHNNRIYSLHRVTHSFDTIPYPQLYSLHH